MTDWDSMPIRYSKWAYIHPFFGCSPEIFCDKCHRKLKCRRKDCTKEPTTEPTKQDFYWCYGCEEKLTKSQEKS